MANEKRRLPARDWERYFRKANIRVEDLDACKSSQARSIKIGQFLSPNVGREVLIDVGGRTGKAVLRVEEGRAKEKGYFFEVIWDDQMPATESPKEKSRASRKSSKRKTSKAADPSHKVKARTNRNPKPSRGKGRGNHEAW